VAIGSQMALFLNSDAVWGQSDAVFGVPLLGQAMGSDGVPGVSLQEAGTAVAFYWGGAMIGRALGSALLALFNAARLLALFTAVACAMCLYVFSSAGVSAGFVALAIGLFQLDHVPGDLHPDARALEREHRGDLGAAVHRDRRRRVRAAAGRALSDHAGYVTALVAPAACYALLCLFALAAAGARVVGHAEAPTIH
jgi:FHS family L-fucose permease-like MFS transporter